MATSHFSRIASRHVLRTAKNVTNIAEYFIAFYLFKLLTYVADIDVGKFIVYSIGIQSATLLILNVVFCFFLYFTKRLVLSGHAQTLVGLNLRLLTSAFFINTSLSVCFITTSYKVLLWTLSFAFRPLKLLDAVGGFHNHYRVMASIRLLNLYVELALLAAGDRIEHWFNVEISGIRRLLLVNSKIPRLRYSAVKEEEKKRECVICQEYFRNDDIVRIVCKSKHCYHMKCIDEWLRDHLNCPICRANVFA